MLFLRPHHSGDHPRPPRRARRVRGTILILVLGTILVMTALVAAFLTIAQKEIILRGAYFGRENMRRTAWQALEGTLAVLNTYLQLDNGLYGPSQWGGNDILHQKGWPHGSDNEKGAPIFTSPEGMDVTVTITDLTGLMPLNKLSDLEMTAVLSAIGISDASQSQMLVDTFRDWTRPYTGTFTIDGAGADYYESLDPGYDPPYSNITSLNDFHYMKNWQDIFWDENGQETPMFEQFKRIVTLRDTGNGGINVNTAPPEVIQVLGDINLNELDPTTFPSYMAGQDGTPGTADDLLIRNSDEESSAGVQAAAAATGNSTGNTTGNTTGATSTSSGNSLFAAMGVGGGAGGAGAGGGGGAGGAGGAGAGAGGGAGGGGAGGAGAGAGAGGGGGGRGGAGAGGGAAAGGGGGRGGAGAGGGGRGGAGAGGGGAGAGGGGRGGAGAGTGAGGVTGGTAGGAAGGTTGGAAGGTAGGAAGGTAGAATSNTTNVGVGFLCRLLKINVEVTLGDTHFLLSVIVQPNNIGTGMPTGLATTASSSSTGGDFTPSLTNTSGAYPFKIINWAENYDLP